MSRLSTVPILYATRVPDLGSTHGGDPSARAEPRPIGWCRHCARAMHLGAVSSVLGSSASTTVRDFYRPPGFWFPAVPILLVGILLFVLPFIRSGVHDIARTVPAHSLVGIQALRLAAIGTLIKTINGEFRCTSSSRSA